MSEIVLVTGSSGCLGHHVVRMLISHDDNVSEIRCLDIREPQDLMKKIVKEENEKFKLKNENKNLNEKKILTINGDIRDVNVVEKVIKNVDCVIHCAAAIDLWSDNDDKNVEELESINVSGTENLLKACIRFGIHKFIHVSSFEVYSGIETIYYATENTLPIPKWYLFGPSAWTKKEAENKVKQYSNNKLLQQPSKTDSTHNYDSLNAIIVRFPTIYGEFDRHYVSKILEITKFFGGTLRRLDNIWIRQQPIYVGNAAWSLLKAKQKMTIDQSISGEGKFLSFVINLQCSSLSFNDGF